MARNGKPIVNGGADLTSLYRRLAGPMVTSDQQDEPLARFARALQRTVDRVPRAVEVHSMQVDDTVRPKRSGAELPIPSPVERRSRPYRPRREGLRLRRPDGWRFLDLRRNSRCMTFRPGLLRLARQGPNACCHPSPELSLVRAEVSRHSPGLRGAEHYLSERAPARRPRQTCLRPSALRPALHPKTCRSGSGP